MSIDERGWVSWANKVVPELRPDKRWADINEALGIVAHSQEGYGYAAMQAIQMRDDPPSFMFWLPKDGGLVQFAPVTASVWCNGNHEANKRYWPVEMEGVAGEPINERQMEAMQKLIGEWEAHTGRKAKRGQSLFEHNEVATRWEPNAGPTSCPSGRYDPLWANLEENPMEDRVQELEAKVAALEGQCTALLAQLTSLNKAIMDRLSLFHIGSGDIAAVREAIRILEEGDD